MAMIIHFFCLCPLSLTIKLNFDISKVAYSARVQGLHKTNMDSVQRSFYLLNVRAICTIFLHN